MKRKPPTRTGARFAIERMTKIYAYICTGTFPNATTMARALETSTKTVHRDIEFLRDRIQLPIVYNGSRFGYTTDANLPLPWWLPKTQL